MVYEAEAGDGASRAAIGLGTPPDSGNPPARHAQGRANARDPSEESAAAATGARAGALPRACVVGGPPGSGRTTELVERFLAALAEPGSEPATFVTASERAAAAVRARAEAQLRGASDELAVWSVARIAERLLRRHARLAAIDPSFPLVGRAERVLLVHDALDRLAPVAHDPMADPAQLAASLVDGIDRFKGELLLPEEARARAETALRGARDDSGRAAAARAVEVARAYELHERMLAERGWIDRLGAVVRAVELLRREPSVRRGAAQALGALFVDDYESLSLAEATLVAALASEARAVTVAVADASWIADRDAALRAREIEQEFVVDDSVKLGQSRRAPVRGQGWRVARTCDRAERAQLAAALCARAVSEHGGPSEVAVVTDDEPLAERVALALERLNMPTERGGRGAFFRRPEVRDVIAWLRAIADPADAAAAMRALARPPIELAQRDLARLSQSARRRRIDVPSAVAAALTSDQLTPEGRERLHAFHDLYTRAARAAATMRPDAFVLRLVRRLGMLRGAALAGDSENAARARNLGRLVETAARLCDRDPDASLADLVRLLSVAARAGVDPLGDDALEVSRAAVAVECACPPSREVSCVIALAGDATSRSELLTWAARARTEVVVVAAACNREVDELLAELGAETLELAATGPLERGPLDLVVAELASRLGETVSEVAGRIGEMRLDTHVDVDRAVVALLDLIKAVAVSERARAGEDPREVLAVSSAIIERAATDSQRELLARSSVDALLAGGAPDAYAPAANGDSNARPAAQPTGLEPFIPRRGDGLLLSASDLETYRLCPLRYKFARVFRIPQEPTLQQRFGIALHQTLERFHLHSDGSRAALLRTFEACWRRAGLGQGPREQALRERARRALERYFDRFGSERAAGGAQPLWFERGFAFRLGRHLVRGRVDRVDRRADGSFELIDYKTGKARSDADLADDIQLSLYQLAAREAWGIDCAAQSYLYVLTGEKVEVPATATNIERVVARVEELAAGIAEQRFEPRPAPDLCAACDYRILCPASEV
mgnify:CR=1 FL=1